MQAAVALAKAVDKASHLLSRRKSNKSDARQLAREMDLPTDSESEEDEAAVRQTERERAKLTKTRAQLSEALKKLPRS